MKIEKIFIEKACEDDTRSKAIQSYFPKAEIKIIDKIENFFGVVKKPYLQKRESLNIFIGYKKGQLVKPAPDAYGLQGDQHFYFIHSYNCIYECEYCYLQGYFHSPDLVFFINHDEIAQEIQKTIQDSPPETHPWFHAGEFSDSLALSHITDDLRVIWDVFEKNPRARLELRTKSANIKMLRQLKPLPNIFVSFSLSPAQRIQQTEHGTPALRARLAAMHELHAMGFALGIHLDPIIYEDEVIANYTTLIDQINEAIPLEQIAYISLGVVRFTKDVYYQVQKNYPESDMHALNFTTSFDEKVRYSKPFRMWILNQIEELLLKKKVSKEKVYLCME